MYFVSCILVVYKWRFPCLSAYSVTHKYPDELINVIKSSIAAALAGLVYGGLPAARLAKQRYIQVSQAELYTSRVDAVVSNVYFIQYKAESELYMIAHVCQCLFFTFYSVQSALRTQRSNSQFCKIWLEVELEGGCFCNYVQVRKNKNAQLGFKLFYATVLKIFWPISVGFLDCP